MFNKKIENREFIAWFTSLILLFVTIFVVFIYIFIPNERSRTDGLIRQPDLDDKTVYGAPYNITVDCKSWSNRKLDFKNGAKIGDQVLNICTAVKN